jgi:hypothetical protein
MIQVAVEANSNYPEPAIRNSNVPLPPAPASQQGHCIFFSWGEDDIGCADEIARLNCVFREKFNYRVVVCKIPSEKSQNVVEKKLEEFMEPVRPEDIMLIYYGGHGGRDENGKMVWSCTKNGPNLTWHNIQLWLEGEKPNMVFILDCCFAASAAQRGRLEGVKVMIGACGWEHRAVTGVTTKTSYTAILIEEILKFKEPFTIFQLHSAMMRRSGATKLDSTPTYCLLSQENDGPITLYPTEYLIGAVNFNSSSENYGGLDESPTSKVAVLSDKTFDPERVSGNMFLFEDQGSSSTAYELASLQIGDKSGEGSLKKRREFKPLQGPMSGNLNAMGSPSSGTHSAAFCLCIIWSMLIVVWLLVLGLYFGRGK